MKITYTEITSQQKWALFQPDKGILPLASTSSRLKDMEIKDGAPKAEKEDSSWSNCPALQKSFSTISSIQKIIGSHACQCLYKTHS